MDVQSSGNRFFVGDLRTLKTNDSLQSAPDALRFAEDLHRHGGRPAVGLMGVPLEWAERFGRAPVDLFDACTNVSIATAMFADYYQRCSPAPTLARSRSRPNSRRSALVRARYCIVTSFARDLGVATAGPVILRELVARTRAGQEPEADTSPERSPPLGQIKAGDGGSTRATLFLDPVRIVPGEAAGSASSRVGSR